MVATISSCLESIRMVRDKVQRNQVWSSLGGWATELVVERALFSAGRNLSPSSALVRIMEVMVRRDWITGNTPMARSRTRT